MEKKSLKVVGLGTVVLDHLVYLENFPTEDSKNICTHERFQVGGPVPTALALMAKFGCASSFIGAWGKDWRGNYIAEHLTSTGINQINLSTDPKQTGFAQVWINQQTGTRTIACQRGAEFPVSENQFSALDQADLLYLDGWPSDAAIALATEARKREILTFMDAGSVRPRMNELLALTDHLNCPQRFIQQHLNTSDPLAAGPELLKLVRHSVTITLGDRGAWTFLKERHWQQPALPVRAVDTNGAGDVFAAALAYATVSGQSWEERTRFAAAAAALKVTKEGNTEALPSLEAIEEQLPRR